MQSPVFGVIVKDERGEHVFVTNTMLDGVDTGSYAAGEEVLYSVTLELHFAQGRWTASPAVAHQDGQRFADWWEDGVALSIMGQGQSGGLVDLPHETRIERLGAPRSLEEPVDA